MKVVSIIMARNIGINNATRCKCLKVPYSLFNYRIYLLNAKHNPFV